MATTRRDLGWWWAAWLIWALVPSASQLLVWAIDPAHAPQALVDAEIATLEWIQYLWVVIGVVAALVTGRGLARKLLGALAVVVGAGLPLLITLTVGPLLGGAGVAGALILTAMLYAAGFAGLAVGYVVAVRGRPQVLWSILVAFVLFALELWASISIGNTPGLQWLVYVLPAVVSLIVVVVAGSLARRR